MDKSPSKSFADDQQKNLRVSTMWQSCSSAQTFSGLLSIGCTWIPGTMSTKSFLMTNNTLMPRSNPLRLTSTGFTSRIDIISMAFTIGVVFYLSQRGCFHYKLDLEQFPTCGDRMNRDITGYEMMYIEEYPVWPRKTYIRECTSVGRVIYISQSCLPLSFTVLCSRLGESIVLYSYGRFIFSTSRGHGALGSASSSAKKIFQRFFRTSQYVQCISIFI